jgi:hypothetical protein
MKKKSVKRAARPQATLKELQHDELPTKHEVLSIGKLGCLPPRPAQLAKCLAFRKYASSSQLPAPPQKTNWREKVTQPWGMMGNDALGNCTCASVGHLLMSWSFNAQKKPIIATTEQVIELYERVGGYVPGKPWTDNGAVIIDVLNYWRKVGFIGNKLGAYVSVQPIDHVGIMQAISLFGALKCGVNLPLAWQNADIWDAPSRGHATGKFAPGSWGGHDVPVVDYDEYYVYVVTWGGIKKVTYAAVDMYFSEMYAMIDSAWFNGQKVAPNGFSFDVLQNDLAYL